MTITAAEVKTQAPIASVIEALPDFSEIEDIQPDAETGAASDYDIGYSRLSRFYERAARTLASDLTRFDDMEIDSNDDVVELLCYLIDDADIRRVPGWSNVSESRGGAVSLTRSTWDGNIVTEARRKYEEQFDALKKSDGKELSPPTDVGDIVLDHITSEDFPQALEDEGTLDGGFDIAEWYDE